jgi:hypothetical protein
MPHRRNNGSSSPACRVNNRTEIDLMDPIRSKDIVSGELASRHNRLALGLSASPDEPLASLSASPSDVMPAWTSVWWPGWASSIASHSPCSQITFIVADFPCFPRRVVWYTTHNTFFSVRIGPPLVTLV